MDFDEFQQKCVSPNAPFGDDPDRVREDLLIAAVGMGGEAGEVLNGVKKLHRPSRWPEAYPDGRLAGVVPNIVDECGDVLFYMKHVLEPLGYTLEDAALALIEKLDRMRTDT